MAEEDTKDEAKAPTPKASPEEAAEKKTEADGEAGKSPPENKPEASSEPEKPAGESKKEQGKPSEKPAAKEDKEEPPEPPKTSNEDTKAFLGESEYYSPEQVEDIKPNIPAFRVPKEKLVDAMRFLRDVLHYEHLACITALDWQKGDLEVVYNLWSYSKNRPMAVRVACTAEDPVVPSVTSVWKGADWLEREEFDLMGIRFEGHPDLRRIMLPEGWQGHPLRKEYEWKKEQYVGMDDEGNDVVYQEAREDAW